MKPNSWRQLEEQTVDGKYYLQRLLGAGSYGGVFLGDEVVADRLIRQVAVKLMETDPSDQDGQMRELIVAANLDHPALLRSYTCGMCELNRIPLLYLITELAEQTLETCVQAQPLLPAAARSVAVCIASALAYLHTQSNPLVHRDVKPANVMRVGSVWKLGDFGLMHAVDLQNPTQTAVLVGTAAYAPPESYQGAVTSAWDLWSLGILLAEALTGRLPFAGGTSHRLMIAVSSQEPDLPADLPQPLDRIIRGCLLKEPAKRWTALQVLAALEDSKAELSKLSELSSLSLPSLASTADAGAPTGLSAAFYSRLSAVTQPEAPAVDRPLFVSALGQGHYRTISEAVRNAEPNRRIRVLPGHYQEQVVLDRAVEIEGEGACGSILLEGRGMPCLVMRTEHATVRGLTLISRAELSYAQQSSFKKHAAVEIGQGALTLEACDISCTSSVCVAVHGNEAKPTLRNCNIHDGKTGGITFAYQASGILENCEVYANSGPGIAITQGAAPHLNRCRIYEGRDVGVTIEEAGGLLEECEIYKNEGSGLNIGAGANPTIRQCRLYSGSQTGVSVRDSGQGTLEECDIYEHVLSNVTISQGASPHFHRCRIYDGQSNGVWVSQNSQGVLEECALYGNTFAGIKVSHGGNIVVRRTTLRDGKRTGLSVQERGRATLTDCDIASNAQAGVQVEVGGWLLLQRCIVRDGGDCGIWLAGEGLIEECDVSSNQKAGIEILKGGKHSVRFCKVHDGYAVGILAQGGAQAIIYECDIYANALAGVAIGQASRVDVRSCRLYEGKQVGLVFWDCARGIVEECEIYGNTLGGVRIRQGSDPLLRNCHINANGYHGVHVSERSEGAVMHCDLTANQEEALFIEAGCVTQASENQL